MKISLFCLLALLSRAATAQSWRVAAETGALFNRSYFDQPWEGVLSELNPFIYDPDEGDVVTYFQVFFSNDVHFGATVSRAFKNGAAYEIGAYRSGRTVIGALENGFTSAEGKTFGDARAHYHQIDVPLRFKFPVHFVKAPKQLKNDLKKGKTFRHLTVSAGLFASFLGSDFSRSIARGRTDKPNPSGGYWELQYELRPSLHRKTGLGAEFGLDWECPIDEKITLVAAARAAVGITSMVTYDFFYLYGFGANGAGMAQFNNDSFSFNFGISYAL